MKSGQRRYNDAGASESKNVLSSMLTHRSEKPTPYRNNDAAWFDRVIRYKDC